VSLAAVGCPNKNLEPGYTAVYDRTEKKLTLNPSDTLVTLWASNELHIEDKSLEETARLLENWYNIRIEVPSALKHAHYYTFTVRHESVADLLNIMQKIGKFQYKIGEHQIVIYE
jgi:ferric-dicitrate binding protein FerR (iron transport regulator)